MSRSAAGSDCKYMRVCNVTIGTASAEVCLYHLRTMRKLVILVLLTCLSAAAQMKYGVVVMAPSDANAKKLFHGEAESS